MRRSFVNWRKLLPIALILVGAVSIPAALAADLVGIGSQTGLGGKQITLALAGFTMLLSGSVLVTPPGQRYLAALCTADTPPASLPLIATWFGLLAGWGATLVWFYRRIGRGWGISMGPDFLWMVPLANLLLFVILGFILSLMNWRWPKLVSLRTVTFILAFTGSWSLLLLFPRLHKYAKLLLAAGLAVQTVRIIGKHPGGFHRLVRYTTGWVVMLRELGQRREPRERGEALNTGLQPTRREFLIGAGAAIAGMAVGVRGKQVLAECRTLSQLPRAPRNVPNVLLIVLDTVRAQSLSLHGYHRPTTPYLARLAAAGVCFERAMAPSPWTLPSHASIFTGRHPHELSTNWRNPLDDTYPTLAEVFRSSGYHTAGFVANMIYCTHEHGLDRGFVHYEDYPISPGEIVRSSSLTRHIADHPGFRRTFDYYNLLARQTVAHINRDFLRWLASNNAGPFFVFLNYFDAHAPYMPPKPFDVMFGSKRKRGNPLLRLLEGWEWTPQQIQVEMDAYDGTMAYLDHHLELLLGQLGRRGILENTLVIITSDHGEEFGEHGFMGHGSSLYLQSLHVPLLISCPPLVPVKKRVWEPVTLRDLPATLIDLLDMQHKAEFPGRSLERFWEDTGGRSNPANYPVLSEVDFLPGLPERYPVSRGDMKSLFVDQYHYIVNGDGRQELYDFENDPLETRDLADSEEGRRSLERFRMSLETILAHK